MTKRKKPALYIFYTKEGPEFEIVRVLTKRNALDYLTDHPELGFYKYVPTAEDVEE